MSAEKDLIPKLDLESFVFTPPGPMGWAFEITEEEEAHVKQGLQNIIAAEETLSLDSLVELSSHRQIVPTNATVEKVAEVVRHEEKQEASKEIDKETIDEAIKKQKEEETEHELAKVEHEEKQEASKEIDRETIDEVVKKQKEEETEHELAKVEHEEIEEVEEIEETKEENNDEIIEIEIEVAVAEDTVTIILPRGPLKAPWLLNNQLKRFKK